MRIRALRQELDESDIVKTRLRLAEELLAADQPDEAARVAEGALTGVFKDDPHTLASVARIRLETGKPREALEALSGVNTKHDRMLETNVAVMRGRALFQLGRQEEAQAQLRAVETRSSSEEPRYFLALSLDSTGHKPEGRAMLEDIVKKFRRGGRAWRRSERHWFQLAREHLKANKRGEPAK